MTELHDVLPASDGVTDSASTYAKLGRELGLCPAIPQSCVSGPGAFWQDKRANPAHLFTGQFGIPVKLAVGQHTIPHLVRSVVVRMRVPGQIGQAIVQRPIGTVASYLARVRLTAKCKQDESVDPTSLGLAFGVVLTYRPWLITGFIVGQFIITSLAIVAMSSLVILVIKRSLS